MGQDLKEQYIQKYLSHDIRFHTAEDDEDLPTFWYNHYIECVWETHGINLYREFSDGNQYSLLSEFVPIRDTAKVIVEIGVARLETNQYDHTSTTIFLNNKKNDTLYLGIDTDDKTFLDNAEKNIHTLKCYSQDYETVKKKFTELGIEKIDFLFIDGWHSVNQVLDELFYFDYLVPGSVIGYHDTNYHRGPMRIIEALRKDLFDVRKRCDIKTDWGVSFATKL